MAYGWILCVTDAFQLNSGGCPLGEEREMSLSLSYSGLSHPASPSITFSATRPAVSLSHLGQVFG